MNRFVRSHRVGTIDRKLVSLQRAKDGAIFLAARAAGVVVVTKDADFVRLVEAHGPPPQILWLTMGNTANDQVRDALTKHWSRIVREFADGEPMVEIGAERER